MRISRWFRRAAVLGLCLTMLPLAALASSPGAAEAPGGTVEAVLREAVAAGQSSDLIIEFSAQADLSAAYGLDWEARGTYVQETLRAVAERFQAGAIAYLDRQGLQHQTFLAGNEIYVWGGSLDTVLDLSALTEVAYIRAPRIYYLDPIVAEGGSPEATLAWGIADTHADDFWGTFGFQGDGMIVSNIDTGVQWDHPGLVNQFKCASPSDPACWRDPSNICGGSACDNNGHGTHTMGTMVADDNPALPYIAGMAPNAQWIACKGCESNSCSDFALNTCADWILAPGGSPANRPHVVNNSWGGGGGDAWYLSKVNAWRAAGIFPAFSAGNNYSCGSLGSPGDYQESFASAAHASNGAIASFSSKGPSVYGHDPYTKPNLSAPGVSICSSVPTNGWTCGYSGTSMASPHTAGAVALLWSCNSSLVGQIDQTFQILQTTADTAPSGGCGAPPDGEGNYTFGYGYLNALAAGTAWCSITPEPPAAPADLSATAISDSQINLTWTDNATNESGFEIERSTEGGPFTLIETVGANVTTYSDTGLAVSTTYAYQVRAYNGAGPSAYSNVASATTLSGPPSLHVSNIEMSWQQLNRKKYRVLADVTIIDAQGALVVSAAVLGTWTLPNGKTRSQQLSTDSSGTAYFNLSASPGKAYGFCVNDVTKAGYDYNPGENVETCDSVAIP